MDKNYFTGYLMHKPEFLFPVIFQIFLMNSFAVLAQDNIADKKYKTSILEKIDSLLISKYVYPDKAILAAEQFRKIYVSGAYDSCGNAKQFAAKVTADLQEITRDKHMNFRVIETSSAGEKAHGSLHHSIRYNRIKQKEHTGFYKLEWFDDGGIGYLDLRRFNALDEAKELLNAAMVFLKDANALIIDIRENGGGMGDFLSNYFLTHPTQLTGEYVRTEDYTDEFWTTGAVESQRMTEVPLFILTSGRTFSAAETFAFDMQVLKRAVLIGDSTRGGAHSVGYFKIDNQFEIYIPIARAVNPVTGGNWEGVGVIPDIPVPDSAALDTALVLARRAAYKYREEKDVRLKSAVNDMQRIMDKAEALYRNHEIKKADAALDSVFAIGRPFGLITEFFLYVLESNFLSENDEPVLFGLLRKKLEWFPDSPSAHESVANAYYFKGKMDPAERFYKKSLELEPENLKIQRLLKKIQNPRK